jgi:hypothetical protein
MLLSEVPELAIRATDDRSNDERIMDDVVDSFALEEDSIEVAVSVPTLTGSTQLSVTPASVILTHNILDEFAHVAVDRALQIRHLVTNKLVIESDNADPRVRLRALELLGKISDVGLFSERSEVVITHQSSSELEDKLRSKLRSLMDRAAIIDVEVTAEEAPASEKLPTPAEQLGAELELRE